MTEQPVIEPISEEIVTIDDVAKLDLKALEAKYSTSKKLKKKLASLLPKRVGDWLYRLKVRLLG